MKKLFSNKNKILAGGLLITMSTLVSCKKLIQIPVNPSTQITREQQFADSASVMSAVAGVYSYGAGSGSIPYGDANLTITTSLSANEITYTGRYWDVGVFSSYTVNPLTSEVSSLWASHYSSIYAVNDVLHGITNNSSLSASFVKQMTGEMDVVRAFYYFYLTNLFGGVPLVISTDYNTTAQLPQATQAAVYTQILTDLNDAVKKLTAAYPTYQSTSGEVSSGPERPNLYTAIALMAKVHLYQGNWQAAYTEADSVIKYGGFSLEPNLSDVFLDGSKEAIWQLPIESATSGSKEAQDFLPYASWQTPNFIVTDSLLNQFETGDQRLITYMGKSIITVSSTKKNTYYYPAKYKDRMPTDPATDYMMMRFAEVLLIQAEAAAEMNKNLSVAVTDINLIRNRAGLVSVYPTTAGDVLTAVRKERRTEMCFEWGNRWFDLNRTINDSKYLPNGNINNVLKGYNPMKDGIYPVPQSQIIVNTHLIQNPGYH
jgi:hypothetical protein